MEKWNLPLDPVPSWLSSTREVHIFHHFDKHFFAIYSTDVFFSLGCGIRQAIGAAANAVIESAWGQKFDGNNPFGWKLNRTDAERYRGAHEGMSPMFFRAHGNKALGASPEDLKGGDPPTVIYWGFSSAKEAYERWLEHFVPKPNEIDWYGRYRKTGNAFWAYGDWFRELIRAGYKGTNTRVHPEESIATYEAVCREIEILWAQTLLHVVVDGIWGPKSEAACAKFQTERGLKATGILDVLVLESLGQVRNLQLQHGDLVL